MIEKVGNIWHSGAEAICVPTNGIVKANGEAVMGAGMAKAAAEFYPPLPKYLGHCIQRFKNEVFFFPLVKPDGYGFEILQISPIIVTFPTKNHWKDPSKIELIEESAKQLAQMAFSGHLWKLKRIALPRVGCGKNTGQLDWSVVKPVLETYLIDNRFEVWNLY